MGIPNHEWESGSGFRDFQEGFLFQATCVDKFQEPSADNERKPTLFKHLWI